ncbi:MAG TPA: ATP-binding protein [Bacillota bacterium]|nr:ATP-binding protein [Bacillota bacterium]
MKNYERMSKTELIEVIASLQATRNPDEEREGLLHDLQVHQIELEMQNQELRETQNKLEETTNLYADLYDFAPLGYISFDDNGVIQEINLTGATMLGKERSRLIGSPFRSFVIPDDFPKFRNHLWKCCQTKEKITTEIGLVIAKNQFIQVQLSSIAIHSVKWATTLYRTVVSDITELTRAKDSLQKTNQQLEERVKTRTTELTQANAALASEKDRLAVTLFSIGDGVITTDIAGRIVLINRVAENLTGWMNEVARGKFIHEVFRIVHDQTGDPYEDLAPPLETLNPKTDAVLLSQNGLKYLIDFRMAPIYDLHNHKIGSVLIFHDITHQREMEKESLKIQKLESLGVLAAGIAHDFNNFLAGILANIQLSALKLSQGKDISLYLKNVETATQKATGLTKQLLTFAKGGQPVKKVAAISGLIQDTVSFALRGSNVRCEFSIPGELWRVEIDEGQITQVINNLIINAVQAMPEGGIIIVRAENIKNDTLRAGELHSHSLPSGDYLKITIIDHGMGIPAENLPYIFDPYFTTKQTGSGLGLATSYSIIKKHLGSLEVESSGSGTTFSIYLPASFEVPVKSLEKTGLPLQGTGKILLMDDEEIIRNTTGEMLRQIGYQVHLAEDGIQAIDLYTCAQESGKPYDMVIMDLTIPGGMGGKETLKKLVNIDPHIKAIVSSGYSNDQTLANYQEYGFCGVVSKPYRIEELHEKLQNLIMKEASA